MGIRVVSRFFLGYCALGVMVASCTSDVSLVSSPEVLERFHQANIPSPDRQKPNSQFKEGEADLYMDFSGSMHKGIERSSALIDHLLTVFNPSVSKGYAVHDSVHAQDLPSMLNGQGKPFFAKSVDNYRHDTSRLDLAIDRIVSQGRTAVFLTDFRREDGTKSKEACGDYGLKLLNYHNSPWAAPSIQRWLRSGHRIQVYSSLEFGASSRGYSPRLFLMLFVQQHDTSDQSVAARIARLFAKDRTADLGPDWPVQSPLEFQLQDGYLSFPSSSQGSNSGLREGLACLSSIHNKRLHYSYYRFERASLVSALEEDSVLSMELSMPVKVAFAESKSMVVASYDITNSFEAFAQRADSVTAQKTSGISLDVVAEREGWTRVNWFWAEKNSKGLASHLKLYVSAPLTLPTERTLFQVQILSPKHYLKISPVAQDRLKWRSDDGCEMRALASSLVAALQNSPVPDWIRYTIYVEILN